MRTCWTPCEILRRREKHKTHFDTRRSRISPRSVFLAGPFLPSSLTLLALISSGWLETNASWKTGAGCHGSSGKPSCATICFDISIVFAVNTFLLEGSACRLWFCLGEVFLCQREIVDAKWVPGSRDSGVSRWEFEKREFNSAGFCAPPGFSRVPRLREDE